MTTEAFIDICEKTFSEGKVRLGPMQREIYLEKLKRFDGSQLDKMFEKVLETAKHFPKIAEIFDSARDCGYLQTETDNFRPHHWEPTDCGKCHGEGRLCIIWLFTMEERPTGILERRQLTQVFPYTKSFDYTLKPNEYRSIFRCECFAGDASTIPKIYPKWTRSSEPVREKWL